MVATNKHTSLFEFFVGAEEKSFITPALVDDKGVGVFVEVDGEAARTRRQRRFHVLVEQL